MLTRSNDVVVDLPESIRDEPRQEGLDLTKLLAMARRQAGMVVGCVFLFLALGVTYLVTASPKYTAGTTILIDSRKASMTAQSAFEGALLFETGAVDSQVQVILSEKIAYGVVDKLRLHQSREFMLASGGPIGTALATGISWLNPARYFSDRPEVDIEELIEAATSNPLFPDQALRQFAVEILQKNVNAIRIGRSYVLNVAYTSTSPQLSAQIANEFATQYLTDQLESRFDATRRASVWLEDRLEELRRRSLEASSAVQQFKAKNNLVSASGRLVSEQQLSELNTQVGLARTETARMQARFERLQQIVRDKQPLASVTESIGSPVINELRVRFLQASKTEAEISTKLGPNHIQAANLRAEMREYERLILDELTRLAENTRSEYQIALDRQKATEAALEAALTTNVADSALLVKLAELERDALTHQNLYQTYLGRFQEAMQQQSFPVTEARVITPAVAPMRPSGPRALLVLPAALILGGMIGTGIGLLREYRDRVFRNAEQVRDMLGLNVLGMLPALPRMRRPKAKDTRTEVPGVFTTADPYLRYALDNPLTPFAEALRSVKVAADLDLKRRKPMVLGITSVFPGEGKTTTAKNMASLFALHGARTLLIDADLRNPDLTRNIAPQAKSGLPECLAGSTRVQDLLIREGDSGLAFLAGATHRRIAHTSELLGSLAFESLLAKIGSDFDYIILDLPPVGSVVDARAVSPYVDRFVFVLEWGRTPMEIASTTLAENGSVADKCIGVVMTKVVMKKLRRYDYSASYVYEGNVKSNYYAR